MRVVSLFSGAGGLDLGFKMAGHDVVWANDLYEDAVHLEIRKYHFKHFSFAKVR